MSALGRVRIGHKAPDFHCEAVVNGVILEVSLSTYIHSPSSSSATSPPSATTSSDTSPWLLILFIPTAFSFVCPTEVLAFQTCLSEFQSRNCNLVFISVDTKHSLWHWQNVPRQYGGLGKVDIPLLRDANQRIARDYGVLVEEEGVTLRCAFLVDGGGVVQQITLNNLTNLQRKFGVQVTDLDEVYKGKGGDSVGASKGVDKVIEEEDEDGSGKGSPKATTEETTSQQPKPTDSITQQDNHQNLPSITSLPTIESFHTHPSHSAPTSIPSTPAPTSCHPHFSSTAASSSSIPHLDQTYITTLFSPSSNPNSPGTGGSNTPSHGKGNQGIKHNTYSSRRGSHVVLDFAEIITPPPVPAPQPPTQLLSPPPRSSHTPISRPQTALRAQSYHGSGSGSGTPSTYTTSKSSGSTTTASSPSATTPGQTRLQATFEAIRKMGVGLGSPLWKDGKEYGYFDGIEG
ncbi:hypothetical protein L13192_06465 [Pyrenophora tritici-repentis]|nr:hypothetical protein L13192_06465 [Pyrenophora tritici-repentis]KAI1684197.1 hypothetical protein KJE20_06702 [Pyrenophora tritici-repentis]